jgi:Tol biopolymer transport system component
MIWAVYFAGAASADNTLFTPEDAMSIERSYYARISPNGDWIAYTVHSQREPNDKPGSGYSELYLVSTATGEVRPFITGKVNVSSPRFNPDGSYIAFLMKRGDNAKR